MTARTTESTVTFTREFNLSSLNQPQPLHLPAVSTRSGRGQAFPVDRAELESVLKADGLQNDGGKQ